MTLLPTQQVPRRPDVYGPEDLDFSTLVRTLSMEPYTPCSLHVRNSLLSPYCAAAAHPSLSNNGAPVPAASIDHWALYRDYRRGVQLFALGDVPDAVRRRPGGEKTTPRSAAAKQGDNAAAESGVGHDQAVDDPLWALMILAPSYQPGWVKRRQGEDGEDALTNSRWSGAPLLLWLSSERAVPEHAGVHAALETVRKATAREEQLLHFVIDEHLPRTISAFTKEQQKYQAEGSGVMPKRDPETGHVIVDLFAVNHSWVQVLDQWSRHGNRAGMQLRRANPCMSNVLSAEAALRLARDTAPSSRWQCREISNSYDELALVRDSNSIPFPLWYIRNGRHRSVLVADRHSNDEGENVGEDSSDQASATLVSSSYPTSIGKGRPAGWAYSHDNLSLASLHVAQPYRRIKKNASCIGTRVSNQISELSVGKICVAAMAPKLIEAQRDALRMSGASDADSNGNLVESLASPYLSDTEMDKGPARSFFEKLGLHGFAISTWGAISLRNVA